MKISQLMITLLWVSLGQLTQVFMATENVMRTEVEVREYTNLLLGDNMLCQSHKTECKLKFNICLIINGSSEECQQMAGDFNITSIWNPPRQMTFMQAARPGYNERAELGVAIYIQGEFFPLDNISVILEVPPSDRFTWSRWSYISSDHSQLLIRHRSIRKNFSSSSSQHDHLNCVWNTSINCPEGVDCQNNSDVTTINLTNNCDPNPCLNDGVCVDAGTSFRCYCRPGYAGPICQLFMCDIPEFCSYNGVCNDSGCTCDAGFTGSFCETYMCDLINCTEGFCDVPTGECVCDVGYTGPVCDVYLCDLCDLADYQSNGTCNVSTGECYCNEGFYGDHCEYYFCGAVECQNNATCIDETQECNCTEGFNGTWCEHSLCEYMECRNGGTCHRGECYCPLRHTGEFCQHAPPPLSAGEIAAIVICCAVISAGAATLGVFLHKQKAGSWKSKKIEPEILEEGGSSVEQPEI